MAQKKSYPDLRHSILRLTYAHFLYAFAFAASIIVYDASQLIAPAAVLDRWKYVAALLVVTTGVWYFARTKTGNVNFQKWLIAVLVFADIAFASFVVYADRGMASLAVALYVVPIAVAATLLSRSAVLATAALSTAAYAYVSVKYFVDFFNEGYKVQLYSTIGFYAAMFFVLALILITVIGRAANPKE